MVINSLSISNDILNAIRNDELVVFAGAGVSVGEPTCLPSFDQLADNIAKLCGVTRRKDEAIEEFFGSLHRDGKDVKKLIAEQLHGGSQQPNELHKNLLRLFGDEASIKIVTTNQDVMFEKAAKRLKMTIQSYVAPALPRTESFNGIVHLHGAVTEPDGMVMEDRDFGHAYMLNGYASRFLVELLEHYVVLFIGYSYGDVIVRYLTSSIPKKSYKRAYLFTEKSRSTELKNFGPEIIPYPDKQHHLLHETIKRIVQYSKYEVTDWEKLIKKWKKKPASDIEMRSILVRGIGEDDVLDLVYTHTTGTEWLEFLDEQGVLDALFDEKIRFTDIDYKCIAWIRTNYLYKGLPELILKHQNRLNPEFCNSLIVQMGHENFPDKTKLYRKYLVLFREYLCEDYILTNIVEQTDQMGLYDDMIDAFFKMIEYRMVTTKPFFASMTGKSVEYGYQFLINEELIQDAWDKHVSHVIPKYAYRLMERGTEVLVRLSENLNISSNRAVVESVARTVIEEDSGDFYQNAEIRVICAFIEETFRALYQTDKRYADSWIMRCAKTDCVIIKRLVLKLVRLYSDWDAEACAKLVLDYYDFHDTAQRDQVFRMIASCYDDVHKETRETIIRRIERVKRPRTKGMSNEEIAYHIAYIKFNWLSWLNTKCKHTAEVRKLLSDIQTVYPEMKMRKHPDLAIESVETYYGSKSPISMETLHEKTPKEALQYIDEFQENRRSFEYDRYGLLDTLSDVIKHDNIWGRSFLEVLCRQKKGTKDIWQNTLYALADTTTSVDVFTDTIRFFHKNIIRQETFEIVQYLWSCLRKDTIREYMTQDIFKRIIDILQQAWKYREKEPRFKSELADLVWNSTSGLIADSMVQLLGKEHISALPDWFLNFFNKALSEDSVDREFIFIICSYYSHFYSFDQGWTKANVLPLFEADHQEIREAAWVGYLTMLGSIDKKSAETILPMFRKQINVCLSLQPEVRRKYIECYVLILLYVADNPLNEHTGYLLSKCTDEDRKTFAWSVYHCLSRMNDKDKNKAWKKWLKRYWELRLIGIPVRLSKEEYEEMLSWLIYLGRNYKEGIYLAMQSEFTNVHARHLLYPSGVDEVMKKYPKESREFLIYLKSRVAYSYEKVRIEKLLQIINDI